MRRKVSILFALVALVIWLVLAQPREGGGSLSAPWFYSRVAAQDPNTHLECVDGTCQEVAGCGEDDCSGCQGCDPNQELDCINGGGTWDSGSCTCIEGCDPYGSAEEACYYNGGNWDPISCYCDYPSCNPYIQEYTDEYDCSYCDDISGDYYDCTCYDHCWTVYCEDGTIVDSGCDYGTGSCVVYVGGCGSG
jgi:hypothetical protein